jgi:hypothetical protein
MFLDTYSMKLEYFVLNAALKRLDNHPRGRSRNAEQLTRSDPFQIKQTRHCSELFGAA